MCGSWFGKFDITALNCFYIFCGLYKSYNFKRKVNHVLTGSFECHDPRLSICLWRCHVNTVWHILASVEYQADPIQQRNTEVHWSGLPFSLNKHRGTFSRSSDIPEISPLILVVSIKNICQVIVRKNSNPKSRIRRGVAGREGGVRVCLSLIHWTSQQPLLRYPVEIAVEITWAPLCLSKGDYMKRSLMRQHDHDHKLRIFLSPYFK